MATVDLELVADFTKASKSLSKFSKEASSSLDGVKSAFMGLAAIAGTALAAFSLKKITDAASEQEQAIHSMNTALALTGEYSQAASKDMQEFADELKKNSMYSDDAALSLVGLTKQMGATNEQTQKIIQAAADLSAITGDSLDSSVEKLSKTLSGNAGRLAITESGVKSLTEAQLKAGVGIDVIAAKYAGLAKEMTKTFAGAVKQTQNAFGDLTEELGFLITKNPVVIKAIRLMGDALNEFGEYIKANQKAIINFSIDGIANTVKMMGFFVDAMGSTAAIFINFGSVVDLAILTLGEFAEELLKIGNVVGPNFANAMIRVFEKTINLALLPLLYPIKQISTSLEALGVISEETNQKIQDLGFDGKGDFEELKTTVTEFTKAARESFLETSQSLLDTKDNFTKAAEKIDNFADSLLAMKDMSDESAKSLKKLSDTNAGLKANIPFGDQKFLDGLLTGQNILDGIYATIGAIAGGAQGARKLVSGAGGAIAAAYGGPAAGAAASSILDVATQGREAVKAQVKAFIEELPNIVEALADASPAFWEALIESMPQLISALIRNFPKIYEAFAIGVYQATMRSLPQAIKDVFGEFMMAAVKAFHDMFSWFEPILTEISGAFNKIFETIGKLPEQIFGGVGKLFEKFFMGLNDQLGGVLSKFLIDWPLAIINGMIEGVTKAFDVVVDALKSVGDGVSQTFGDAGQWAKRAIVADATGGMSEVIGGGDDGDYNPFNLVGGANNTDTLLFRVIQLLQSPIVVSSTAQVNQREFANIILELNRQNARLA